MRHTISALVENQFGVLARIAGMFSGRGFNIDTLNVGPTHDSRFSRVTITVVADEHALDQAVRMLEKLVNVIEVTRFDSNLAFVGRELVMVKIAATPESRSEIVELADIFSANIVDVAPDSIMVECTANNNKILNFLEMIKPYGIIEMARTGSVALPRGLQPDDVNA